MGERPGNPLDWLPCAQCGRLTHIDKLDAKPGSVAFRKMLAAGRPADPLKFAAAHGLGFDRLECGDCYGPGYLAGP